MLRTSAIRVSGSVADRCSLCGHHLLRQQRALFSVSSRAAAPSPSSASPLRLPRWASSSSSPSSASASYSTTAGRSLRPSVSGYPARFAPHLPARRAYATIVEGPTAAEDDLPEPPLKGGEENASTTISVTAAAERQLARIQQKEKDPNLALRILVESGGCHGYSTKLQVADVSKDRQEDDYVLAAKSSASASDAPQAGLLLVDALTLSLIRGSTLDYATELIGSSFRLVDNPQAKGAGCGCGVSWELKIIASSSKWKLIRYTELRRAENPLHGLQGAKRSPLELTLLSLSPTRGVLRSKLQSMIKSPEVIYIVHVKSSSDGRETDDIISLHYVLADACAIVRSYIVDEFKGVYDELVIGMRQPKGRDTPLKGAAQDAFLSEHLYAEATFDDDGPMRIYITKHQPPPLLQEAVAAVETPASVSQSSRGAESSGERVFVVKQMRKSFKGENEQLEKAEIADSCAYAILFDANEPARALWHEEKADEEHEKETEEIEKNAGSDAACYSGSVRVWTDRDNGRVCAISVQELAIRKASSKRKAEAVSEGEESASSKGAKQGASTEKEQPMLSRDGE